MNDEYVLRDIDISGTRAPASPDDRPHYERLMQEGYLRRVPVRRMPGDLGDPLVCELTPKGKQQILYNDFAHKCALVLRDSGQPLSDEEILEGLKKRNIDCTPYFPLGSSPLATIRHVLQPPPDSLKNRIGIVNSSGALKFQWIKDDVK